MGVYWIFFSGTSDETKKVSATGLYVPSFMELVSFYAILTPYDEFLDMRSSPVARQMKEVNVYCNDEGGETVVFSRSGYLDDRRQWWRLSMDRGPKHPDKRSFNIPAICMPYIYIVLSISRLSHSIPYI